MNISYSIFEIQRGRKEEFAVQADNFIPVERNINSREEAEEYIKKYGYFDVQYVIIPVYDVTIDDLNERGVRQF